MYMSLSTVNQIGTTHYQGTCKWNAHYETYECNNGEFAVWNGTLLAAQSVNNLVIETQLYSLSQCLRVFLHLLQHHLHGRVSQDGLYLRVL